jgi:hydroxymethylglutaryl-CoA reductase
LDLKERQSTLAEVLGLAHHELRAAVEEGGLTPLEADKVVENVIGTYSLPLGVALNVQVNGRDHVVPMVVEEPSVIAAASNAARMVRASGGFVAEVVDSLSIGQIQITEVPDVPDALDRLRSAGAELLALAALYSPGLVRRGGGPRSLEIRALGEDMIVLHVLVDCLDAMGANLINTIVEALAPTVARIAGGKVGLRILSNLNDRRRVRVRCSVRPEDLESKTESSPTNATSRGDAIVDAIVNASRFAELDSYRAATHNKGIMNGIDAVAVATGNDYRAIEAGAHAYAARAGTYRPLATWSRECGRLKGELEMPLALGTVGGTIRVHRAARLALKVIGVESAGELAMVAASVGLASNLAALRALATEGIQRGHMSLHARSVALAAGATGDEVQSVASIIASANAVTLDTARLALAQVREQAHKSTLTASSQSLPLTRSPS